MTTTTAPAPPDNRLWYLHQSAGRWMPPLPCDHRPDPVFGPCTCQEMT